MAFNIVFISLFATLPAPMAYGALIDSTWCRSYQKLQILLHKYVFVVLVLLNFYG
jgi:hypothetical protein